MARTTAEEMIPPTIEITTKSRSEIDRRSNARAIDLARAASASDTTKVSVRAERTFWPTTVERRRDDRSRKRPTTRRLLHWLHPHHGPGLYRAGARPPAAVAVIVLEHFCW